MERVSSILEREGEALEVLLFKLIETKLLLTADEARFLPRATREVERARARARELDLLRAATVVQLAGGATLRDLAAAGTTVVFITHDPGLAAATPRVVTLVDGRVESDRRAR